MTNYIGPGDTVTRVAPVGGVVSGAPVLLGSLLVVPGATAAEADTFGAQVTGEFRGVKPGSQAWTQGAKIYWDNSAMKFTTTSGGNTLVGTASEAVGAGADETAGIVRLDGVAR